jgi:anti-anti-sigma factor
MAADPSAPSSDLKLEIAKQGAETVVRATGRITSATAATLETTLRSQIVIGKAVILDLAHVDYVDSAGLGALVGVYIHAKKEFCDLFICNPNPRVRDLFNQSGLASVFQTRH